MTRTGLSLTRFVQWATAALLALAIHGSAVAQAPFPGADGTIHPAAPRALEQIWVKFVCIDLERCAGGTVSMAGNTITVVRYNTLQPGQWTAYNKYSGPIYRTTGPWFGGPYASGPALTETPAGTATLTFADPANGTLQFNVDGAAGTKAISRLKF